MSSEIYELMKRSDEGAVVEKAHRRPRFVEDCVREMVGGVVAAFPDLGDDIFVSARQENLESIHQHNVVAERFGLLGELRARARHRRAGSASRLDARVARRRRRLRRVGQQVAQPVEVVDAGEHGDRHRDVDEDVDPRPPGGRPRSAPAPSRPASIVLSLPQTLAEMTWPCSMASMRRPVTANSREMITIATHASRR